MIFSPLRVNVARTIGILPSDVFVWRSTLSTSAKNLLEKIVENYIISQTNTTSVLKNSLFELMVLRRWKQFLILNKGFLKLKTTYLSPPLTCGKPKTVPHAELTLMHRCRTVCRHLLFMMGVRTLELAQAAQVPAVREKKNRIHFSELSISENQLGNPLASFVNRAGDHTVNWRQ